MMWADTLASPEIGGEKQYGFGNGWNKPGDWEYVPGTNECIDMLPKDIIMLNWTFTTMYANTEEVICSHGFEMVYGNLFQGYVNKFDERTDKNPASGAMVSNLGSNEIYYARINNNFYALVRCAYLLWNDRYDESRDAQILERVYSECYRYYNKYMKEPCKEVIEITHTTDLNIGYSLYLSARKVDMKKHKLGDYVVMYDDGTTAKLPVVVCALDGGWNISTLEGIARNLKDGTYRVKILKIYPAPENKQEQVHILEEGKQLIQAQLDEWRALEK